MQNIKDYIESGILELYVMGITTEKKNEEIVRLSAAHPSINQEIENIIHALVTYVKAVDIRLHAGTKTTLLNILMRQTGTR